MAGVSAIGSVGSGSSQPVNSVANVQGSAAIQSGNAAPQTGKTAPQSKTTSSSNTTSQSTTGQNKLTPQQQQQVDSLKKSDTDVRAHELAHLTAGGSLIRGGASYTYKLGPDGKLYAVAGEVQIDLSVDKSNPQAAIARLEQAIRAALAPTDPSAQDRSVAAQAAAEVEQLKAQEVINKDSSSTIPTPKTNKTSIYTNQQQNIPKGSIINNLVG